MVDLGDTSGAFSPLILAEQAGEDSVKLPIPPAKDSEDTNVVDLRSLGFKKGKLVSVSRECRLLTARDIPGDEVDKLAIGAIASRSLDQSVVTESPQSPAEGLGSIVSDKVGL